MVPWTNLCPCLVDVAVVVDVGGDANVSGETDGFAKRFPTLWAGEARAKPRTLAVQGEGGACSVPVWCTTSDSFASRKSTLVRSCLFTAASKSSLTTSSLSKSRQRQHHHPSPERLQTGTAAAKTTDCQPTPARQPQPAQLRGPTPLEAGAAIAIPLLAIAAETKAPDQPHQDRARLLGPPR